MSLISTSNKREKLLPGFVSSLIYKQKKEIKLNFSNEVADNKVPKYTCLFCKKIFSHDTEFLVTWVE